MVRTFVMRHSEMRHGETVIELDIRPQDMLGQFWNETLEN